MLVRVKMLVLVTAICVSSAAYSQSLEEVIEHSDKGSQEVVSPVSQTIDSDQKEAVIEGFFDIFPVSQPGMIAIDKLLAFIRIVLGQVVVGIGEIDMNDYKPSPTAGEEDNEGVEPEEADIEETGDEALADGEKPAADPESSIDDLEITGTGSGSAFMKRTEGMNPAQREEAILTEILAGNIPSFLKNFKEIEVSQKLKDGRVHSIKYKVMPDYLAIGSDSDFVRMPMSPLAAQVIAEKFNCILPTTRMVDDIYRKAQTTMLPQPMSGGQYKNWQARMTKNEFYVEHQRLVETQCQKRAHQNGMLIAGHKKDVVISNHLNARPKNVVIYGWHDARNGGKPIQGYGWSHENTYADYSHGIRLVNTDVTVDGKAMNIKDVLADPVLCDLLSKEGPVKNTSARR